MPGFRLSGSPRTAARQFIELLTRDNILDEDGNVNTTTVEAACHYAGGQRCLEEAESPRSHAATANSTPSSKSETPVPISEQCTQEEPAPPADTSRSNNSAQDANTTDTQGSRPAGHPAAFCFPLRRPKDLSQVCD